jgi:hypothetical protein
MRKLERFLRRAYFRIVGGILLFVVDHLIGADAFWNDDDPECQYESIEQWINEVGYESDFSDGPVVVTFQRALRLPNRTYEVIEKRSDDSDDVEHEWRRA